LYQTHWFLQHTLDSIHLHMIHEGSQLVP
jgi:hypothetical protein